MKIKRALLSVYDKSKLVELGRFLSKNNIELISSGGTARLLKNEGITVTPVSEITGFPEMLDGRVKTLHPFIHGGILAQRTPEHLAQLAGQNIMPIDLVVVNLYPFEQTIARSGVTREEAIEQIDIGGPTLLRSAAKNHQYVTVLSSPDDYEEFMNEYRVNNGEIPAQFATRAAQKVFALTSKYDAAIATYLGAGKNLPETFMLQGAKKQTLRYGENHHQKAALYQNPGDKLLGGLKQLHGKQLSFNNIMDLQSALALTREFAQPACTIIKHNNPCGVGVGDNLLQAHSRARSTDEQSAFGSIITFNGLVDITLAEALAPFFTECIIAPEFSPHALERLQKKKNLRLLTFDPADFKTPEVDIKCVSGGFLVQEGNTSLLNEAQLKIATKRPPTVDERSALEFAWKIVKHVKSNAIVFCNSTQTLGIGAGQMSRVDATSVAVQKAKNAGLSLKGSAVASDAFFPFKDSIETLGAAGASAVIQPGGSIRDDEVIEAANTAGISMLFTGIRHFKH